MNLLKKIPIEIEDLIWKQTHEMLFREVLEELLVVPYMEDKVITYTKTFQSCFTKYTKYSLILTKNISYKFWLKCLLKKDYLKNRKKILKSILFYKQFSCTL